MLNDFKYFPDQFKALMKQYKIFQDYKNGLKINLHKELTYFINQNYFRMRNHILEYNQLTKKQFQITYN